MKLPERAFGRLLKCFAIAALATSQASAVESLTERWRVQASEDGGFINELTTGSTERGMAYNAVSDKVLVVSRANSLTVVVLEGADADNSHTLDLTGVAGGFYPLNAIGVADDGAVYACNLALNSASPTSGSGTFRIYRWANDDSATVPTLAFEGDPAGVDGLGNSLDIQRWGDSIDVRGSGANTQILIGTRASAKVAVLTGDGEEFVSNPIAGAGNATGSLGVAFGVGDTVYTKDANQPLRYSSFDLNAGSSALLGSFGTLPAGSRPIGVDVANARLAAVVTTGATLSVLLYDITEPTLAPILADTADFDTANINNIATGGAVSFGGDALFALITNNGIAAYDIEDDNQVEPPQIDTQPFGQTVIEGGAVSFSAVISGTPPFDFQWQKDSLDIAGADASSFDIPVVTAADAGSYTLTVTNSAASVISDAAVLTTTARVDGAVGTTKWQLGNGDRTYLAADNAQRGMDINPTNGNVLLVSRTGGAKVLVIDGADGSDLHPLDTTGVGGDGAIFPLSMLGVADDGAVYASNLSLDGSQYRILRWADDDPATVPTVAFDAATSGNPLGGERLGDTIAVRGIGVGTQILAASRLTAEVALFTTTDGTNFTATPLTVAGGTGNYGLGLSFDAGNVFWGNAQGGNLVRVTFDPVAGTAAADTTFTTADFPASVGPIAVGPQYGLLAGISNDNPDHIQIYDISNLAAPPVLLDQEFLISDNGNSNGTGSLAFGDGVLVGLGTNNGLTCLTIDAPESETEFPFISDVVELPGDQIRFTLNGEIGKSYTIQDSTDLTGESWDDVQLITLTTTSTQEFTFVIGDDEGFFRVREEE